MVNAQEWLNENYPHSQKESIKELNIEEKNLQGSLDLSDFVNLNYLNCYNNELTSLNLSSCIKLEAIECHKNQLTNLDLSDCSSLTRLNCYDNKLTNLALPKDANSLKGLSSYNNNLHQDLTFLKGAVNLEGLCLRNNNFTGSLKHLRRMEKLWILDINDTDIDSGLEYLPESVKDFSCSAKERPEAKCQTIYNLFADCQGKVETEYSNGMEESIKNFPKKLQDYKQITKEKQKAREVLKNELQAQEKQVKELKNYLMKLSEIIFFDRTYTFDQIQQEITRLKLQELAPRARREKEHLEQLIINAKTKANNLEKIVDLLLETKRQIIEQGNDSIFAQGQLTAYQTILEGNLTKEELQTLLSKQTELFNLEKHLVSLQINEQPRQIDWNNLHLNFTPELIQAWQNHNFTAEQARDWINIHSSTDQNQAIQEPEFYAWLRDIKEIDSDWVLNHGNHQSLKQKYQTYKRQNQSTAQILQPTNLPGSNKPK